MSKAIRIHAVGGPEVMKWENVPTPQPGPGEALVRHAAIGLNYIDTYFRSGVYKTALPATLGMEGAGTVLVLGEGVTDLAPGDRVAYAGGALGAYAGERVIAADRLVKLPDAIDFNTAAAMMLQGMTAQYLLRRTYRVQAGETILVHAAAGGVGLILCQWAKASRCQRDRRGLDAGESRTRHCQRRRPCHRRPRQPGGAGEEADRRRDGAGGV